MSDWYPIANPPDDCEPVLFYEPAEICRHDGIIISGYMHGAVPCDDTGRKVNATHWHRLPAAPLSGSQQASMPGEKTNEMQPETTDAGNLGELLLFGKLALPEPR